MKYSKIFFFTIIKIEAVIFFISMSACQAQIKNEKTVYKTVYGNCEMCKSTIENAGSKSKSYSTIWNKENKIATISFDSIKSNADLVLKQIALAGYDNEKFIAPDNIYQNLPKCCQYERPEKKENKTPVSTTAFQSDTTQPNGLQSVYDAYFELKDALILGDAKIVSTKADKILKALNAIQMETLGNHHDAYMNVEIKLKSISQKIQESNEIEIQRNQFSELSTAVYKLLKITKAETTVYYDHCPMFNNGKGADWLSKEVDIKNPYYGSVMLNCGKVIETIKP